LVIGRDLRKMRPKNEKNAARFGKNENYTVENAANFDKKCGKNAAQYQSCKLKCTSIFKTQDAFFLLQDSNRKNITWFSTDLTSEV